MMEHLITVLLGYMAIMNPLANAAVFCSLTEGCSRGEQRAIAIKSLLITFVIISLFALMGKTLFELFGITLPALRVAGGILVFFIGYHMLQGASSSLHAQKTTDHDDISVSPLAMPILAGPGTIATTINYSASGGWSEVMVTMAIFTIVCLVTYVSFIFGRRILNHLGDSILSIITRLMGLILAVIGVQMGIDGVFEAIEQHAQQKPS